MANESGVASESCRAWKHLKDNLGGVGSGRAISWQRRVPSDLLVHGQVCVTKPPSQALAESAAWRDERVTLTFD